MRRKKTGWKKINMHSQTASYTDISFVYKPNTDDRHSNESIELVCDFGSVMH